MDGYLITALVALILLSAFFSASETAISTVNRIRLSTRAEEGNKRARLVLKMTDQYDRTLSSILVGNNIVNIAFTAISTMFFTGWFGLSGVGIATLVTTAIVLVFGEILPKSFAREYADSFAPAIAYPLCWIIIILTPLVALLLGIKKLFLALFRPKKKEKVSVTERELKHIIEEIEDEGVLEKQESELVQSALDFDEITAEEILTPRVDVVSVPVDEPVESIKDTFLAERYSRIPVYENGIDNVIGVLYSKDFFAAYVEKRIGSIRDLLQPALFVPPQKKISELLSELQKSQSHLAIVVDQYGGNMGIVTMEDILEELVGEIWDEFDEVERDFAPTGQNTFEVSGDLRVSELIERLEIDDLSIETGSNTVGGWVLESLGHIPEKGESFRDGRFLVTVGETAENRILRLVIEILPDIDAGAEKSAE